MTAAPTAAAPAWPSSVPTPITPAAKHNMRVPTHTGMHTRTYACTRTRTCTWYLRTLIHTHAHANAHAHAHANAHAHAHAWREWEMDWISHRKHASVKFPLGSKLCISIVVVFYFQKTKRINFCTTVLKPCKWGHQWYHHNEFYEVWYSGHNSKVPDPRASVHYMFFSWMQITFMANNTHQSQQMTL